MFTINSQVLYYLRRGLPPAAFVVLASCTVVEQPAVKTRAAPIFGKGCGDSCPKIADVTPKSAESGSTIRIFGSDFTKTMRVKFGDDIVPVNLISDDEATVVVPDGATGKVDIEVAWNENGGSAGFLRLADDIPIFTGSPDIMCSSVWFYSADGALFKGTKECGLAPSALKPEKLAEGFEVGGVVGTLPYCKANSEQDCIVTGSYKAMDTTNLTAGNIKKDVVIGGIVGAYPSASFPLKGNTYFDDLTSDNFATKLTQSQLEFEFFDSFGGRHVKTGDADLRDENIRVGIEIENLGLSGKRPFTAVFDGDTLDINLAWIDQGAAAYLIITSSEGEPSFVPKNGVIYSAGQDLEMAGQSILYSGAGTSATHESPTLSKAHHYALYSRDASYNYSGIPLRVFNASNLCNGLAGGEWVAIPGNADYGTNDFCIMKYEAKNVAGVATSQAASAPWVGLDPTNANTSALGRVEAATACGDLGAGFKLVTNDHWMTVGAALITVADNWSENSVGSGTLHVGHRGEGAQGCQAGPNYVRVRSDCSTDLDDEVSQKRTMILSNQEEIWDFAGNVWEWIDVHYTEGAKPGPGGSDWSEFNVTNFPTTLTDFIPQKAIDEEWNSNHGLGMFVKNLSAGGMIRGGGFDQLSPGGAGGMFNAHLLFDDTGSGTTSIGFRCVKDF